MDEIVEHLKYLSKELNMMRELFEVAKAIVVEKERNYVKHVR